MRFCFFAGIALVVISLTSTSHAEAAGHQDPAMEALRDVSRCVDHIAPRQRLLCFSEISEKSDPEMLRSIGDDVAILLTCSSMPERSQLACFDREAASLAARRPALVFSRVDGSGGKQCALAVNLPDGTEINFYAAVRQNREASFTTRVVPNHRLLTRLEEDFDGEIFGKSVDRIVYGQALSDRPHTHLYHSGSHDLMFRVASTHQLLWHLNHLAAKPELISITTGDRDIWLTFNAVSGRRAIDDFATCGFEIAGYRRGDTVARDIRLEARIDFEQSFTKWASALGHADACTYGIRDDEIDQMINHAGEVFFPSGLLAFITGNDERDSWIKSKASSAHLDFSLGALKGANDRYGNRLACTFADTLQQGWREHLERILRRMHD